MNISNSNLGDIIGGSFEFVNKTDTINLKKKGFLWDKVVKSYSAQDVVKFKILNQNTQHTSTKGTGGTLGGAAAGGLLFGGAGAVVGAIAGGNKVESFSSIDLAFEFNDGTWIIVSFDNLNKNQMVGNLNDAIVTKLKQRFSTFAENPFNS